MHTTARSKDHDAFRKMARDFLTNEIAPSFPEWEAAGIVPREIFHKIGDLGVLGLQVPERYGGGGVDTFAYSAIWMEETARSHVHLGGLSVHMNVCIPYFVSYATPTQAEQWLPRLASGEAMASIAMTEPSAGSDLAGIKTTARDGGDHYVLNGAKTFITGGINADVVLVVARTSTGARRQDGLSIFIVDAKSPGFSRGRNLDKLGLRTQDTAELFFEDVVVPADRLLGEPGRGFEYLTSNLPQERLSIAIASQAAAETALATTTEYVKSRAVFGTTVAAFQNTKFELASCAVEIEAGRALVDQALAALDAGVLSPADAAKVKIYCTELQGRVVDRCLQLHGGYGYMREYPIARLYADARVTRIFGGSNEVLRTIVAKSIGL
ncbi:acyl-CoA dehydrogenase family protein [Phytohabitans kaempferiae]|uniref:Acyl-[acyl-carrier-protein] dehydrogenase MbtN n=1 Tax=Phytohabitans kaempferiae TaxID=1620943 RepID=A0ABV6MHD6_9ACTN